MSKQRRTVRSRLTGVNEAATIKSQIQGLIKRADALLANKDVSDSVRAQIRKARATFRKAWADLADAEESWRPAEIRAYIEADLSHDEIRSALSAALSDVIVTDANTWGPWVREVFEDRVIYEWDGRLWQSDYSISDTGEVSLGDGLEVRIVYEPIGATSAPPDDGEPPPADDEEDDEEAGATAEAKPFDTSNRRFRERLVLTLDGDPFFAREFLSVASKITEGERLLVEAATATKPARLGKLAERAVRDDGTVDVKLIEPGWGSSGYYAPDLLERDGPAVFPKGTHMFWNHPTINEERERPEGDLYNLAAVLETDPIFREDGPEGPGLYATARVFPEFRETLDEIAPYIGTSIRAMGISHPGEAEGQRGPIIDELTSGQSVDFVTLPGAGGAVLQIFEAARRKTSSARPGQDPKEEQVADDAKVKEAEDRAARAEERTAMLEAQIHVNAALGKEPASKLPEATRTRLAARLVENVPMTDERALDTKALDERIEAAVKEEAEYLATVLGKGKVRGMGSVAGDPTRESDEPEGDEGKDDKADDLEEAFGELGLSESEAKIAAGGRR